MSKFVCDHPRFQAKVDCHRLTDGDNGPVTSFAADVQIWCDVCGMPFRFLCPDGGVLSDRPAISVDGHEIRLPIVPEDRPELRSDIGFVIRPRP